MAESEEERRLRLEMEAIKKEEERRMKEEIMRTKLKEWQAEEEAFSRLNRNKIQNQWRKLMRIAKVESLKKNLEIMSQDHEREVDVKDAIIQMLDRDLDEAQEQYQTALRSHLQNVDSFVELYTVKVRQLEQEFEEELGVVENDFDSEREYVLTKHNQDKKELQDLMSMVDQQHVDEEAEAKQEFESFCEEIKNKNLEDLNVLKLTLESQIDELERHFESAHQNYLASTEQRTQQFKTLTMRDRQAAQQIETQFKRIQRLQESLANWKLKIAANVRECEERNKLLRIEKEHVSKHFQAMKTRMNRMRQAHSNRLQEVSIRSRQCVRNLGDQKKLAENILKLSELNRKLETEREKIIPFFPLGEEILNEPPPEEVEAEASALSSYARTRDGKSIEEWNYLDIFFKRFNHVLLDKCAIEKEKNRLSLENEDLRTILKQYLDGISVNSEVLDLENPLLVVNNRSGVAAPPPVTERRVVPAVEGNFVVNETARMRA